LEDGRLPSWPRLRADESAEEEARAGLDREARRGKVFASRMSWPTLRIFSANGSRASFCRISGFIMLAVSIYAVAGFFQLCFVEIGLLEKLFDARLVLRPAHAGGDGNDVFGAEDFGGIARRIDRAASKPHFLTSA
jgi:hypothetical protein